jgi:hypothetical protein
MPLFLIRDKAIPKSFLASNLLRHPKVGQRWQIHQHLLRSRVGHASPIVVISKRAKSRTTRSDTVLIRRERVLHGYRLGNRRPFHGTALLIRKSLRKGLFLLLPRCPKDGFFLGTFPFGNFRPKSFFRPSGLRIRITQVQVGQRRKVSEGIILRNQFTRCRDKQGKKKELN